MLALYYWYFDDASFEKINYKASTIGTLMMLSLKNMNYKASIIGILMMLEGVSKVSRLGRVSK